MSAGVLLSVWVSCVALCKRIKAVSRRRFISVNGGICLSRSLSLSLSLSSHWSHSQKRTGTQFLCETLEHIHQRVHDCVVLQFSCHGLKWIWWFGCFLLSGERDEALDM